MLKRLLTIFTITLIISCGKDVVEIVDTPIPNEPQEIFEVNIVGYSTDSDHDFLENVDLTINGNSLNSDSTSFFIENKILVGKEGSVIKAHKIGFLPVFKRVYHHRSLEDVVTNISMNASPMAHEVSSEGGDVFSDDGSMLSFNKNVFSQSSEITFYSSFDEENQVDLDPFVLSENEVRMLDNQALFYLGSSEGFSEEGKVSLLINADKISNIEMVEVYKYDESMLTWTLANTGFKEVGGQIILDIDSDGWWALGITNETIYGTLKVKQLDASFTGITSFKNEEIVFSKIEDRNSNEHIFSDKNGEISKYYPIGLNLEISINNGEFTEKIDLGFDSGTREQTIQFNQLVIQQIPAKVFDCQLSKQSGFVSLVKGNQYVIKRIESGDVGFVVNENDENLEFRFYGIDEALLLTRHIETEKLTGGSIHFVACNPVMLVEKDAAVVQDFDQCKVRVKPIESFIVGEGSDNKLFFIAFKGDEIGLYDGLVYADDIPTFSVVDIEKEVKVDIMIYDKISSMIAGFVDGKYKNGEAYKISFIGNIEE